jgi:uncharacterized repeat protein (TIGR02543 family)
VIPHRIAQHRDKKMSVPVMDPCMVQLFTEICDEIRLNGAPQLRKSLIVSAPYLSGCLRPCVMLPDIELDPKSQVRIFRHELTHLKRGDLWVKLLLLMDITVFWFNPLIRVFAKRVEYAMEVSCDAAVLKSEDQEGKCAYGELMLRIMRSGSSRRFLLSTQFHPRASDLVNRYRTMLGKMPKRKGAFLLSAAAIVCCGAAMLVSFDNPKAPKKDPYTVNVISDNLDSAADELAQGLDIPTREGYTFTGWEIENMQETDGGYNVTLHARWRINEHKITYIPNATFCYCPYSQARFRDWLRGKYGSLGKLNGAWYRQFHDWKQVEPALRHHPLLHGLHGLAHLHHRETGGRLA